MNKSTHDIFIEELNKIPADVHLWINQSFEVADKIASLMEKKGLSSKKMADLFNVSEETVSWWIGGTYNFDLETLAKISTFFDEPLISIIK